ncbi:MAG: 3-phosphoshikimate 1-carboxyvinyltransferase [Candidatus Binatia bacterium]
MRVGPPRGALAGTTTVPGDKSIGHRALLLGALAEGRTLIRGFPGGADVLSTLGAIRALGARAEHAGDVVVVDGAGLGLGAGQTRSAIDCGNSGTTMRLGAGLVAGAPAVVTLDGDASLRRRPMERVAEPLRRMGARIETSDGHAPVTVHGGGLVGIAYALPVASAQVKSAVLLAGLRARGTTRVTEPLASRDHTERMLAWFGVPVGREGTSVTIEGGRRLAGREVPLPGDPSSAAFLIVAAAIVAGAEVQVTDVGMNPTRTGALAILRRMGVALDVRNPRDVAGEPRADLVVRGGRLRGTVIAAEEIPAAIDELPILAVAAAVAEGTTTVSGAAELRVKESDRIAALEQLRVLGVPVTARPDGLVIEGSGGRLLRAGRVDAHGDHRIAMAFAVAGLVADGGVEIADPACVDVSFPGFFTRLAGLGASVEGPACPR